MPLQERLFRQDTFYVLRCFGGKNVSGLNLCESETHDLGVLPTKPAHAERNPQGEVFSEPRRRAV